MEEVPVHPLSQDPTAAWRDISKSQRVIKVTMKPPTTTVAPNKARVVCMSDTHSLTPYIKFDIPDGDIFIHAGDFTKCGQLEEVEEFNNWIGGLPHRHKIVIAGNHELSFDSTFTHPFQKGGGGQGGKGHASNSKHTGMSILDDLPTLGNAKECLESAVQTQNVRQVLTNCRYIEDELLEIWGIRIYGSPWQPEFCRWAFNVPRGAPCLAKWNQVPEGIDILVTHTARGSRGPLLLRRTSGMRGAAEHGAAASATQIPCLWPCTRGLWHHQRRKDHFCERLHM